MKLEFKLKIKKLYTFILCGVLFVKNLIFKNSFVLERFLYTNKIIIRGNEAVLSWKITGCHKIIIKNLGLIAGNQSQISLILYKKINPIEITFYGVGGQEETSPMQQARYGFVRCGSQDIGPVVHTIHLLRSA